MNGREPALRAGDNCWRVETAHRSAFLVDGESYFRAFYEAVQCAQHSIWILGWDIDSRLKLIRDEAPDGEPLGLERLLVQELERKEHLQVFVLAWDFAMLYAFERDLAPLFSGAWNAHERLHYHLDDRHPVGGSHHQKVVVIDDALAFVGGMDLTRNRWDSREHLTTDARRTDPDSRTYSPFHDVQMAVDGSAASALGRLARERWRTATGSASPLLDPSTRAGASDGDVWPECLPVDVFEATIGIARTFPAYDYDSPKEVREVESLLLHLIASARRSLYFESQYLTSVTMSEALARSLAEPEGPNVVAVLPRVCSGWLEESTMGQRRNTLLRRLENADRFGRFRAYCPVRVHPGGDGGKATPIFVHSKVVIADDRYARVGSANLSNRSMGLDTECDLVLEADDAQTSLAVRRFRARLLGEHLGVDVSTMDCALERERLFEAIDRFGGDERRLERLTAEEPDSFLDDVADLADPEKPMEPELLLDELLTAEPEPAVQVWGRVVLALAVAAALAALWRWGPLGDWITLKRLEAWESVLDSSPLVIPGIVLAYVLGGLLMVPLTLLILATAASFGPWRALVFAVAGTLASGLVTFWVGKHLGRDVVRRAAGKRLNRVSRKLAERGVLAVAAVRIVPVAPYGIVNLLAGATHIRGRDFMLGTFLGTLPGIVVITLLESRIEALVRKPSLESASLVVLVVAALGVAVFWLRRRFGANARSSARRP